MARASRNYEQYTAPMLIVQGVEEYVTDGNKVLELIEKCNSADKTVLHIEKLYHVISLEPEIGEISESIVRWIKLRLNSE